MGAKEFFRAKAPLGYDPQFWTCVQLVHYCFLYWVDRAQNQLQVSWLLTVLWPPPATNIKPSEYVTMVVFT